MPSTASSNCTPGVTMTKMQWSTEQRTVDTCVVYYDSCSDYFGELKVKIRCLKCLSWRRRLSASSRIYSRQSRQKIKSLQKKCLNFEKPFHCHCYWSNTEATIISSMVIYREIIITSQHICYGYVNAEKWQIKFLQLNYDQHKSPLKRLLHFNYWTI